MPACTRLSPRAHGGTPRGAAMLQHILRSEQVSEVGIVRPFDCKFSQLPDPFVDADNSLLIELRLRQLRLILLRSKPLFASLARLAIPICYKFSVIAF